MRIHLYRVPGGRGSTPGLYHHLFFSVASHSSHLLLLFGFLTKGCFRTLSFCFSLCQSASPHLEVSLCFSPPSRLYRIASRSVTPPPPAAAEEEGGCLFWLVGQPLRRLDSLHIFSLLYSLFFFFSAPPTVGVGKYNASANNFLN